MAVFEQWFKQDLLDPIKIHSCGDVVFNGDNFSNIVGVRVFRGGVPVSLTGTIICNVIRADGATVVIGNGSISGEFSNEASVSLVSQALAIPGKLGVMLQLVNGDNKTTLLKVVYFSHQSSTSEIVDPGHVIPDVNDIIAKFDEMEAAIDACEAAANDIILVQDTQPVEETNKIWLPETIGEGVQVPTLDEFDELKSAISVLAEEFEPLEIVKNEYVKNSNGSFASYAGWFRTNKVKLPDNAKRLLLYIPANTQYSAWYDANGDFISALNLVGGAGIKNFPIPTGAVYFAISNEMRYANSYRYWGNEKMDELFNFLSNDNVPNSTQTVTFTNGKPSSIVHKRNNVAVRTDEITYSGNIITETRTDAETGYWITITTNTQTLTTEVA